MDPGKILIVRTSALGDVVQVLPAVSALREHYPRAFIGWLIEPAGARLIEGHPAIDRLFVFDRARWKQEWLRPASWPGLAGGLLRLVREIRRERFDLVVDFQCNVRSGLAVLLSRGRRRLGFSRHDSPEWGGWLFTNLKAPRCPPGIHKVEKNLCLVRALGYQGDAGRSVIPIPDVDRTWAAGIYSGLPGKGPRVLLHPAVSRFGQIKRWPADRFRALVDRAREELDARVLISWGPGEREMAEAVGRPTIAPPIESPRRLAALAAGADAVVAADTGALHIAAALGTPTVGLYGPKDVGRHGPWPPGPRARAIRSAAPCSPCLLRKCEHRICMSLLEHEDAFLALKTVLGIG